MGFIKGFIGMKTMLLLEVILILRFKVFMGQENMLGRGWIKHQSRNKENFQFRKEMIQNKMALVLHHILVSVDLRLISMVAINSNVKTEYSQQKKNNKNQIIITFYSIRTKVEVFALNTKVINFVTVTVHQKKTLKRNTFQVQVSIKLSVV